MWTVMWMWRGWIFKQWLVVNYWLQNFFEQVRFHSYLIFFLNMLFVTGAMSDDAVQETASELKPVTSSTTAASSSFSVTDILSPLEVVDHSASYMGPASPSEASAASNSAASNHFSAYSAAYSPRSVTPITSMAASAAAAVAATSVSYPHMHSMTQLNSPAAAASFSSGYCQPSSTDLGHHYPDMRTSAASAATGWYSSPAADPRFASEYCEYIIHLLQ